MTVTVNFARGVYTDGCQLPIPNLQLPRVASWELGVGSWELGRAPARRALARRCLERAEVDQRAIVVDDGAVLLQRGVGQIALCLQQLERGRQARGHALLFRLEADLRELARLARRLDALQAGADLARAVADLRRDLH